MNVLHHSGDLVALCETARSKRFARTKLGLPGPEVRLAEAVASVISSREYASQSTEIRSALARAMSAGCERSCRKPRPPAAELIKARRVVEKSRYEANFQLAILQHSTGDYRGMQSTLLDCLSSLEMAAERDSKRPTPRTVPSLYNWRTTASTSPLEKACRALPRETV